MNLPVLPQGKNFLGLEEKNSDFNSSKYVIIPAPLEHSTSYGKGTRSAPDKILTASWQIELFDESLKIEPFHAGIATLAPLEFPDSDPKSSLELIRRTVREVIEQNKFPIIIGGEHSIAIGVIRAMKERYPDFSVLSLDAHSDLRDSYENDMYSHATVLRRIMDFHRSIVICGVRSQDREEWEFAQKHSIPVYYIKDLKNHENWQRIIQRLKQNVYVTFDCDVFDPSVMPAVGTPEPGGLFWEETLEFMQKLIQKKTLIGFDVVELSPVRNFHYPDYTAARLIYKMIGYLYQKEIKQ